MMRRLTALALLVALTLGLVAPAAAQDQYTTPGPGGVIAWSGASTSCVNTIAACTLWSYTIPSGFMATSSRTNQTVAVGTPPPLHLSMRGTVDVALAAPAITIGANFGGSTATISLTNGYVLVGNHSRMVQIDVWVMPVVAAVQANTVTLYGQVTFGTASSANASVSIANASVVGTTSLGSAQTLAVNMLWGGAASSLNSLNLHQRSLQIGY